MYIKKYTSQICAWVDYHPDHANPYQRGTNESLADVMTLIAAKLGKAWSKRFDKHISRLTHFSSDMTTIDEMIVESLIESYHALQDIVERNNTSKSNTRKSKTQIVEDRDRSINAIRVAMNDSHDLLATSKALTHKTKSTTAKYVDVSYTRISLAI